MQDLINKYPELQEILGNNEKSDEFASIIGDMPADDLVRLQQFIGKRLKECEYKLWKTDMSLRNIDGQVRELKEDYKRVNNSLNITRYELQNIFNCLFKNPNEAQNKCSEIEKRHGFDKAAQILHENPEFFGNLKGYKLPFNIRIGMLNKNARKIFAKRYYYLRKEFDEAYKIMTWLKHMLKEA